MFEHSVRVPRNYKVAAKILKKVSTEGGSVKTLLYDNKLRHFRTNVLYALLLEAIKHSSDLDKIFESCNLFATETRLDPWLAKILTTELLFGKKHLPGQSKPEQAILSYKEQFEKLTSNIQDSLKTEAPSRPRYVRINTNLLTTSDAIREFQDEGYRFIRCTSGSYDDYLKQIQGLTEYDFTQDYHVKTIFVFAPSTRFHEHQLYLENKIILQDKATAMAVHLLAPPPGSVVLDMCAAPGMKTTQLAAFMRNQGKIYAVERNEQRYQTLCEFVARTGSTCVETFHRDSLEIRRGECEDVEYILLDPSCSGSGMQLSIHNYVEDERIAKLTSLQEKFLKHAMNAFPKAKKIVYSTCSVFPEENERVVTNIVKASRARWRVLDVKDILKGQWNNFGSAMYGSIGTRCLYAKPESDLTTGFFLAVLERDPKDIEKALSKKDKDGIEFTPEKICEDESQESVPKDELFKKKKKKKNKDVSELESSLLSACKNVDVNSSATSEPRKKKKKKTKNKDLTAQDNVLIEESQLEIERVAESVEVPKKKKKKRKHEQTNDETRSVEVIVSENIQEEPRKKKKKHKNKEAYEDESAPTNNTDNGLLETVKKKKKKNTQT